MSCTDAVQLINYEKLHGYALCPNEYLKLERK